MAAGSTVLTPKRASVRVTYGSQKNKTPLSSSSSSMLQRVAAPRLAGTYAESPKKRKDDLVGDEDEDEDKDGEEQQDTPSAKKRLVQTSLFLGCQLKAVKKPPVSHAEVKTRQSSDSMFPGLSSSYKVPNVVNGPGDGDRWTIPTRKILRSKNHSDKIPSSPPHDIAQCKREQTFLDFGQRPLTPEPCQICGMTFQRGREDDESLHNKFHRSWQQKQIRLLSWDVTSRLAEDKGQVETVLYRDTSKSKSKAKQDKPLHEAMAMIILVDPQCCSKREIQRALTILNIANEHLGAVKLLYEDLLHNERKIMLYISPKGSVEGCILAELIKSARRVAVEEDTQTAESAVRLLDNEEPAVCGISRIWVAPDARRRGVASQMVDILCQRFVYGCQLSRDSLAFTQPTSDGRSLAERVFGRRDFLVYVEE
ncbi:hypothetical protein IW140_001688 [Coemansia sp. RSA 1813]|nr:hypothetical protein LPJ74_001438 [Coemansia sp. RSA 1843]KAJ2090940.1 hypothetical protein IW138_002344 [Coemansia sp. RSA 986]KAJ2213992.1 hypothetical protein EV179_003347 [Coemansia sp. RSA 487]KAJ2571234.1 hypothetical protein IW140_001688 [Coemansia sp. RSA 1813]